jgi:hypothetical protein
MARIAFRLNVVATAACRPANRISIDVRFWPAFEHFQEKWNPVLVRKCDRIRKIEQLPFPWKQKLL